MKFRKNRHVHYWKLKKPCLGLPLVLESRIQEKIIFTSSLERTRILWVIPQFFQTFVHFGPALTLFQKGLSDGILFVNEFFRFFTIWIFHPSVRVDNLKIWNFGSSQDKNTFLKHKISIVLSFNEPWYHDNRPRQFHPVLERDKRIWVHCSCF